MNFTNNSGSDIRTLRGTRLHCLKTHAKPSKVFALVRDLHEFTNNSGSNIRTLRGTRLHCLKNTCKAVEDFCFGEGFA